jgi:hypothetical protein
MSDEQVNTAEEQKNEAKSDPSDNLTPDHPRFKEVYSELKEARAKLEKMPELEKQLQDLQEKISVRQEKTGDDDFTDEELRALERIEKGLARRGFVRSADLQNESFQLRLEREFQRMNEKYDGSNGLPKFIADEVFAFAKRNGMEKNLEGAYRLMHYDTIVDIDAKKRIQTAQPPTSEKPKTGDRGGSNTEISLTDISEMTDIEWEQKREKILQSLKGK